MTPIHRGKFYEVSPPLYQRPGSSGWLDLLVFKLTYRGNIYNYTPRHLVISEFDTTDWPTATLIYRGNRYHRKIQSPAPYQKPRVLNWRWQ